MREFEQAWTLLKQSPFSDEQDPFHVIMNQMLAEDPHHLDDLSSYLGDFRPAEMRNNLENYLSQATSLEDYKNRIREMDSFMNDEIAMRRDVQGEPLYDKIHDFESGDEDYYDAHVEEHDRQMEMPLPFDNTEQAKILAQFQQLNRGESINSFEQAWTLLKSLQEADRIIKNERAELRDATVAARRQGQQVPEVGMSRLDGSPRIGGQQNRLMNYPGQTFQPRPSDTYRSRMPETGPVQSEAMDPEAVRAMGSRIQTLEQSNAQREAMEDHQYPYHLSQHNPAKRVTMEDLVDMPTSHQLAEMRAEATQRAMQKPYRQLNDYERKLVPVPVGLGTLYG